MREGEIMEDLNGSIVESSNDILTEILVRLPPKSIFKFTCVSRRWNNLITDPCFVKRYDCEGRRRRRKGSSGGRLLGFVQCNMMRLASGKYMFQPWVSRHSFLSVSEEGHSGRFPGELGYFISASNGLFLCGCIPTTYHVGNPMTKRWVSLPSPHQLFPDKAISVGLACEEGSNSYQVVVAGTAHDAYYYDTMPIETYSSITGEWRESILTAPYPFGIAPHEPPSVCGGVFHWFTKEGVLVVYDSSSLEEEREKKNLVQLIELPWGGGSKVVWRTDNGQTLWFGGSNLHNLKIFFLPMGKHSSSSSISWDEWTQVHTVGMDTLKKGLIPETAEDIAMEKRHVASQRSTRTTRWILYEHRSFVYMVAFIPWDPRLVLVRLRERIFIYNWESNTMNSVQLHGYPSFTDFEWEWYPYFDSVSLSSYAFGLPPQQQQHIQQKCGMIT